MEFICEQDVEKDVRIHGGDHLGPLISSITRSVLAFASSRYPTYGSNGESWTYLLRM